MNVKNIISDGSNSDKFSCLGSVLETFGFVADSKLPTLSLLQDAVDFHGLGGFLLPDGYVLNRTDAEWRRVLKLMETEWVSFYGAKKLGPDKYTTDKSRIFVGTRNIDFIPPADRAKGVMESGTTWDMDGSEHKWDYVRFFDRQKGAWRSTYKAYMVSVGKIPPEQQVPYTDWLANFSNQAILTNTKYTL